MRNPTEVEREIVALQEALRLKKVSPESESKLVAIYTFCQFDFAEW